VAAVDRGHALEPVALAAPLDAVVLAQEVHEDLGEPVVVGVDLVAQPPRPISAARLTIATR
jgi:hypothetical protein